ncbi:MAG: Holliday junction branch migration protein RuvA [Alphaproteobacteria bacterium]|nr:MAG: Holliday junction branch migration protein RuvA [Alphaproteobacteria bacterium]
MIAKLKGSVDYVGDDFLIIDTGAIGYQVFVSQTTKAQAEDYVTLYTLQMTRQEQPFLVGFLSLQERCVFEMLLNVQGVGMKMALSLMSVMTCDELASAILNQEKRMLTNADGVGNKLAERIILELKNKINSSVIAFNNVAHKNFGAKQDVIETLISLGYNRGEAVVYLKEVEQENPELEKTEDFVRQILKKKVMR